MSGYTPCGQLPLFYVDLRNKYFLVSLLKSSKTCAQVFLVLFYEKVILLSALKVKIISKAQVQLLNWYERSKFRFSNKFTARFRGEFIK